MSGFDLTFNTFHTPVKFFQVVSLKLLQSKFMRTTKLKSMNLNNLNIIQYNYFDLN